MKKGKYIVLFVLCVVVYFIYGAINNNPKKSFEQLQKGNITKMNNNVVLFVKKSSAELTSEMIEIFGEVDQGAVLVTAPIASTVKSIKKEGVKLNKGVSVIKFINGVTISMPFKGTVTNTFVKNGQNVNLGSDLFVVSPSLLNKTKIKVKLPIIYSDKIRRNMKVKVLYNSMEVLGVVNYVSTFSEKESGFVQAVVNTKRVDIPHNAIVRVMIEVSQRYAHFVPKMALMLKDNVVNVKVIDENGIVKVKSVEIIAENTDGVFVANLNRQETIVVKNPFYAVEGEKYQLTII